MFLITMAVGMTSSSIPGVETMGMFPPPNAAFTEICGGGGDALWLLRSDRYGDTGRASAPGVSVHCCRGRVSPGRARTRAIARAHGRQPAARALLVLERGRAQGRVLPAGDVPLRAGAGRGRGKVVHAVGVGRPAERERGQIGRWG
jgi:hypothetical protein